MQQASHQTPNVLINYIEGPANGAPLLLIHGASSRLQSFSAILPKLSENYHVFAIDLRGHGHSGRASSYYLKDFVDDVVHFIEHRIQSQTFVYGSSLGGMITLMIAAQKPEIIRSIMLGDSPLSKSIMQNLVQSQKEMANHYIKLLHNKQITQLFADIIDMNWATGISLCDPFMFDSMFNRFDEVFADYQIENILPKLNSPCLLLHGEEHLGSLVTKKDLDLALNLNPTIKTRLIEKAGHSLIATHAEKITKHITEFLK